jgi:hypothetical protein
MTKHHHVKPFKTAEALKLSILQYESLIAALDLLESGAVKYNKLDRRRNSRRYSIGPEEAPAPYNFNMETWRTAVKEKNDCGTVCCIGGLCEIIAKTDGLFEDTWNNELFNLFHPESIDDWNKITTEQACTAIRSFLTEGRANWDI